MVAWEKHTPMQMNALEGFKQFFPQILIPDIVIGQWLFFFSRCLTPSMCNTGGLFRYIFLKAKSFEPLIWGHGWSGPTLRRWINFKHEKLKWSYWWTARIPKLALKLKPEMCARIAQWTSSIWRRPWVCRFQLCDLEQARFPAHESLTAAPWPRYVMRINEITWRSFVNSCPGKWKKAGCDRNVSS